MERIVTQTIPAVVIDNPHVDWNPVTNTVKAGARARRGQARAGGHEGDDAREPDTRYAMLLKTFQAARQADPYSPTAPTLIARRFDENRQMPEERVRAMLEEVLSSPLVPRVAALIESRLGRPLEPFDIWYNGFRPRGQYTEAELDAIVEKKLSDRRGLPGRHAEHPASSSASRRSARTTSDPASSSIRRAARVTRSGAARRGDKAHLRTRVEKDGMNYKGYNIAVHELGHNVEQTFSLNDIDSHAPAGRAEHRVHRGAGVRVPGARPRAARPGRSPTPRASALQTLNDFWATFEIAGVALVDMAVWHWMYEHPDATPRS